MILWVSQFQCPHGLELLLGMIARIIGTILFQCPLGLIPHFYDAPPCVKEERKRACQCPLGLIPHFYNDNISSITCDCICVNALSGLYLISTVTPEDMPTVVTTCQCPLGLIPHFYGTPSKT